MCGLRTGPFPPTLPAALSQRYSDPVLQEDLRERPQPLFLLDGESQLKPSAMSIRLIPPLQLQRGDAS